MMDELLIKLDSQKTLMADKAFCEELAAALHTFYIHGQNYEKAIIDIIGKSLLSKDIVLMPKQLEMLRFISENNNVVISAPTSFGKSFIILEYIKRLAKKCRLIVYVVHTKSLCTEVYNNIVNYFEGDYNVVDDFNSIDASKDNIFVMISDGQNIFDFIGAIGNIDLLIIDEAYNLGSNGPGEGRFLTIFNTCHELMKKSDKIILAGPFIKDVEDLTNDNYDFKLYKSDYSPVTEIIKEGKDNGTESPCDRFVDCLLNGETTIGFINSKNKIYDQLNQLSKNEKLLNYYRDAFIDWMKSYFPDFWLLPALMEKGISVYHSSFPKYLNLYGMDLFNKRIFKGLFTTSAILEGVNTSAKNIVIFETASGTNDSIILTPFQFFNLCGRAGRLNHEIVGNIYNYGESFAERYNEKSLVLKIGAIPTTKEMKFNLGINDEETELFKHIITQALDEVGIKFEDWYEKNKFFFGNDGIKLLTLLKNYNSFKTELRSAINTGILIKNDGTLHKPKTLSFIYNNFLKPSNYHFKQGWGFSVPAILEDLIRSSNGGITFSFRDFCLSSSSFQSLISNHNTISEKNHYMVIVMRIAYDYIQYEYNYANTLLKEFIAHDLFFDDDDRKKLNEGYFNRINNYLKRNESNRITKYLSDLGLIPPLISKIVKVLNDKNEDYSKYNNKQLYLLIKNLIQNREIILDPHEVINLQNVKLI